MYPLVWWYDRIIKGPNDNVSQYYHKTKACVASTQWLQSFEALWHDLKNSLQLWAGDQQQADVAVVAFEGKGRHEGLLVALHSYFTI